MTKLYAINKYGEINKMLLHIDCDWQNVELILF